MPPVLQGLGLAAIAEACIFRQGEQWRLYAVLSLCHTMLNHQSRIMADSRLSATIHITLEYVHHCFILRDNEYHHNEE